MENTGPKLHNDESSSTHSRSPFDLIVNQIWRTKSFAERWPQSSMSRFFKSSENSNKAACVTEKKELETTLLDSENKENISKISDELKNTELEQSAASWGQVVEFMERLGKKPHHKCLNLNNSRLTANDAVQLAALLPNLTTLEELDLSWNELIGGTLKLLTNQLQHMPQLRVLGLGSCRLSEMDVSTLGDCFQCLPNIEEIDLSWNSDLGGHLSHFTQKLKPDCKLKILKLIDCNLTAEDGMALGRALSVTTRMEVLDLSMNKSVGSGLDVLFQELRHVPRLQVLKLHMCGLAQGNIQALGNSLEHIPGVRKMVFSCNDIGGGFKETAAHLLNFTQLQVLDVHRCSLTEDDVSALTQIIPLLSSLQVLNVALNKNMGHSVRHLIARLRFLPRLKSLIANNCNLTKESIVELACLSCAGVLASLEKLELTYNNITDDQSWAIFFQKINGLKELSELDIGLRPLTYRECGPWITVLLDGLARLPSLTELGMHHWLFSASQQELLDTFNKDNKRNIHFAY